MTNLVAVATIFDGVSSLLFLRRLDPARYQWFIEKEGKEEETDISNPVPEEAFRLAFRRWKEKDFIPLHCGYRYMLPERDEHGMPAYFEQMVKSINSSSGVYYDDTVGYNCIVNLIPTATRALYEKLKKENRL